MKPKQSQNRTRNRIAFATGLAGIAFMVYGAWHSGFGLNPTPNTVGETITANAGLFLLMATPAIVWRKDMLVVALGLLAAVIIFVRLTAGSF